MLIHPIFVHFPIALFSIYAVLECLRFKALTKSQAFLYIKAVLVIMGSLSGFVTLSTGELIEHMYRGTDFDKVVEMHSLWATVSVGIFTVIAAAYLVAWLQQYKFSEKLVSWNKYLGKIWEIVLVLQRVILKPYIVIVLAIAGLAAITITGALGGSLVYGPDVDPFTSVIYHLFF